MGHTMEYGEKIKELRMRLGLSQSAFAAKLGIHKQMVSDVERGKQKRFNPAIEQKITAIFGVDPAYFIASQNSQVMNTQSRNSSKSYSAEEEILLRYFAQIPEDKRLDVLVCLLECIKKYK